MNAIPDEIIENCFIVMDTNVILDLYSLETTSINDIVEQFKGKSHYFWLPNQVFKEYHAHRDECLRIRDNRTKNLKDTINEEVNKLHGKIQAAYDFNRISNNLMQEEKELFFNELSQSKKKFLDGINSVLEKSTETISKDEDILCDFVEQLRLESNWEGFSPSELLDIFSEGKRRYEFYCPPGFTDIIKDNAPKGQSKTFETSIRIYGDLIIWKEMLVNANRTSKHLIFMENERKKDWTTKDGKKNIPEILIYEYNKASNGHQLYILHFSEFINSLKNLIGLKEDTLKDINALFKPSNAPEGIDNYANLVGKKR